LRLIKVKDTAMQTLKLEQIIEIDNYRTDYSDLDGLIASMKAQGFKAKYAITVTPIEAMTIKSRLPMFAISEGHRRTRSARLAGLTEIACHIEGDLTPKQRKLDQLAENENRSNPNPMDQGRGLQQAIDLGATIEDLALATGHKADYIAKRIALLSLTSEAQIMVAKRYLSIEYAYELTRLKAEYQGAALAAYTRASRCDLITFREIVADLYNKQLEAENKQLPMFGGALLEYVEQAVQTIEAKRAKTRAELEAELEAERKARAQDRQFAIGKFTAARHEIEQLRAELAALQGKAA
jgi:ParB/RepB/Spo0J family partition protein